MPCDHQYVSVEESRSVTLVGLLSVVIALIAIGLCFVNLIAGALLLIVAILIGTAGRRKTVIKCAKCGELSPQQGG